MSYHLLLVTLLALLISGATTGCGGGSSKNAARTTPESQSEPTIKASMAFSADSAYANIKRQVEMGPRVPGSPAARQCASWIASQLKRYGADSIIVQPCTATAYNGDRLALTNVMGRFGKPGQTRVLLIAHYDTRPWADREHNPDNIMTPIDGANDGASGVGTLLEIARQLSVKRPEVAVDMLFVDGEDYGKSDGWNNTDTTWCLGTQYWVDHMPADYQALLPRYGILLDMVGDRHAQFLREFISDRYASALLDKVWQIGAASGYGDYFVNKPGGSVIDDHMFTNNAGIPTIDIIDCTNAETGTFPRSWHTLADNLEAIDPATLQAVGQTVTNVIYRERP